MATVVTNTMKMKYMCYTEYIILITACKKRHTSIVIDIINSDKYIPKNLKKQLIEEAEKKGHRDVVMALNKQL